ncbi:MAG TPA: hypothetical protein VFP72_04680, partial [Kineosporiaceae bacterium]|nr:hypothetical protein [Kineosporiaceae bacterium]
MDGGGYRAGRTGGRSPSRRSVLRAGWAGGLLVVTGVPGLSGCRSGAPSAATITPPPTPTPDEVLRRRALAQVESLRQTAAQLDGQPALRTVLGVLSQNPLAQRSALGAPALPPASGTGLPTTSATATTGTGSGTD